MSTRKGTYSAIVSLRFAAILVAIVALGCMAYAQDKQQVTGKEKAQARITAETDVQPLAKLTGEEAQAVSLAAGRILRHTDQARQTIADKKKDEALNHIDQGLTLIRIIENAVPKYKVKTDIKSGDVAYHNEEVVGLSYVPILDEQYVADIVTPVIQVKKESAKSADRAKKGDSSTESAEVEASMFRHTSMRLDVVLARRMLELAKKQMTDNKNDEADDALQVVQTDSVRFELDEIELPLVEAADNLKLAESEIKRGAHEQALATLKVASDALKKCEKLAGDSLSKEVRQLHQEIDKLTKRLEPGERDRKKALERAEETVAGWWNRVTKWMKK